MVCHYSTAVNFPSGGGFVARATRAPLLRRLTRGLAVIRAVAALSKRNRGLKAPGRFPIKHTAVGFLTIRRGRGSYSVLVRLSGRKKAIDRGCADGSMRRA